MDSAGCTHIRLYVHTYMYITLIKKKRLSTSDLGRHMEELEEGQLGGAGGKKVV